MTNRELFHATMNGENGGQLLHIEQGFNIPFDRWVEEGLPEDVVNVDHVELTSEENLYDHMNVSGFLSYRLNRLCIPPFKEKIISEKEGRKTYINENGVTLEVRTDTRAGTPTGSPPHEVDFTFKSLDDYKEHRFRLTGGIDKRYDSSFLAENGQQYREQSDFIVSLWVYGPFAYLRELVGVEQAMILPYTEPEMIRMMLNDHLKTAKASAEAVIAALDPDMCFVWEDCCGSSGPFIAPDIFREFMGPWYREWKGYLESMGVPWILLDTDGDPSPLVPLWYESGVDCMLPWEVNAVDMLKFAEEYPEYTMMGGIYKHIFEPQDPAQAGRFKSNDVRRCIDEELERVVEPMVNRGNYLAALDHWAYWGIRYQDYCYYSQALERYGKANNSTRF